MKPGDHVLIIKGPPDKQGLVGVITFLMGNGAMVRLDKDWYSPIQFNHLELLYRCFKCNNLHREYEMSPKSEHVVSNSTLKLNHDICLKCEEEFKKEMEVLVC